MSGSGGWTEEEEKGKGVLCVRSGTYHDRAIAGRLVCPEGRAIALLRDVGDGGAGPPLEGGTETGGRRPAEKAGFEHYYFAYLSLLYWGLLHFGISSEVVLAAVFFFFGFTPCTWSTRPRCPGNRPTTAIRSEAADSYRPAGQSMFVVATRTRRFLFLTSIILHLIAREQIKKPSSRNREGRKVREGGEWEWAARVFGGADSVCVSFLVFFYVYSFFAIKQTQKRRQDTLPRPSPFRRSPHPQRVKCAGSGRKGRHVMRQREARAGGAKSKSDYGCRRGEKK